MSRLPVRTTDVRSDATTQRSDTLRRDKKSAFSVMDTHDRAVWISCILENRLARGAEWKNDVKQLR